MEFVSYEENMSHEFIDVVAIVFMKLKGLDARLKSDQRASHV
jgi:hypothetical protein